jgi:small subunit ribosomal protein S9
MTAKTASKEKYIEAVGRRKTSAARVRIFEAKGAITVNDKELANYFPTKDSKLQESLKHYLQLLRLTEVEFTLRQKQ